MGELPNTAPDSLAWAIPGMLPAYMHHTNIVDSLVDIDHKATPTVFGGFMLNYNITPKLLASATGYFYGEQTFEHVEKATKIEPKFLLNLNVSYKVWGENEVFVNARNLLGNDNVQFAYADMIGTSVYAGIRLKF